MMIEKHNQLCNQTKETSHDRSPYCQADTNWLVESVIIYSAGSQVRPFSIAPSTMLVVGPFRHLDIVDGE